MPDDSGLKLPDNDDYSRLTFEQVLTALTGLGNDLREPLNTPGSGDDKGWLVPAADNDTDRSHATFTGYSAFGKFWYGVNYNIPAFENWTKALHEIDVLVVQLQTGKLGALDVGQVRDVKALVDQYSRWLEQNQGMLQSWIDGLDSPDSAFRGRAAYALQQNLVRIAHVMKDVHDQITVNRKISPSLMLEMIADISQYAASKLAEVWFHHRDELFDAVDAAVRYISDSIHRYIWGVGLVKGTPNYSLPQFTELDPAEAWINKMLAGFDSTMVSAPDSVTESKPSYGTDSDGGMVAGNSDVHTPGTFNFDDMGPAPIRPEGFPPIMGDLRSKATWNDFNAKIRDFALYRLSRVDSAAREVLTSVGKIYALGKDPLAKVDDNKPPTLGSAPSPEGLGGGSGTLPPGGSGDFHLPPGGDGGDFHLPPGGSAGDFNPPPNGGENYNPLGGGPGNDPSGPPPNGTDNYNPLGGGPGSDVFGPGAGSGDHFNPLGGPGNELLATPPGGAEGGGPLPYVPSAFAVPPLPNSTVGTNGSAGGNGAGYEPPPIGRELLGPPPGGQNGTGLPEGWTPPALPESPQLPPLTQNGLPAPPGMEGMARFNPPPGLEGPGAPGGLGVPGGSGAPGGFGAPGGLGAPGAGEAGSGGGLGGSGEGWSDWSGDLGSGGGHPELTPGVNQVGGMSMPMIPPMMGGMGGMAGMGGAGGAAKERERERQTWLSEDEKVWGTEAVVGSGVIGRPDGEPVLDEPLTHRHVHVRAASRTKATRGRHAEAAPAMEGTQAAEGAESTGSAGTA